MDYKPKIVMTQDEFRVLASTTRIDIMKLLDESQLTVSDVSRRLEMNKATVHEHLNKLIEVGLVKKEDTNRKWVYYSLTWKGKNLLHPERVKVMVALATIAIAVVIVGLIIAMQGVTVPTPGEPPLTTQPTVTTDMMWQGAEHDLYDGLGWPATMNMEFKSSSAAVSVASVKQLDCYFEYGPTSLTRSRVARMEYAMEGNVIHIYDRSHLLRSHGEEYLVVELTVLDGRANPYHFTLRRLIVPPDRPIDLLISALGVRIDTSNLNLTNRMVRIYFTVENRGTVNVTGARYYVASVLPSFSSSLDFIPFGSPYLRMLANSSVDVPANGTSLVEFNVTASLLGLRGVVAFLNPESSVPEQNVDNNRADREVPPEVKQLNTPPPTLKQGEHKAPGMEAVPAIAAALAVAMLAARARRRRD